MTKYLIINADDFGMSEVFNQAILALIRKNLVSSTTVMVNRINDNQEKQLKELITLSREQNLSVGLHLEFCNEDYSSQIILQHQRFKELFNFEPTHIDIHKAHDYADSYSKVAEFCKDNNLPLRNSGKHHEGITTTFSEAFFGSVTDFKVIKNWLKSLKRGKYYEILFHPGKFDPDCKSSLNKDRERDIDHIKKLHSLLEENDIQVVSYLNLVASS